MNRLRYLLIPLISSISIAYAAGKPITIGIMHLNPPFETQAGKDEVYGFDIDMMNNLCKIMQRTCTYRLVRLKDLIPSVIEGKVDVAVSSITITAERAKAVNFSMPYMLSYASFLTKRIANPPAFSLKSSLVGKTVAVKTGDIYKAGIMELGIKNLKIKEYLSTSDELEALNAGEVDYLILDDPVAHYWSTSFSGQFMKIGPAYKYGYGFGIAVKPGDLGLLADINKALLIYQNSEAYKVSYNKYIAQFNKSYLSDQFLAIDKKGGQGVTP